jgi:hypothetical protein
MVGFHKNGYERFGFGFGCKRTLFKRAENFCSMEDEDCEMPSKSLCDVGMKNMQTAVLLQIICSHYCPGIGCL